MTTRVLLLALSLCGACLTRTDLGAEPTADASVDVIDGGDGAPDVRDPERDATRAFEKLMVGRWRGALPFLPDARLEYEFRDDSTYRLRGENDAWSELRFYFVTDLLASGRFVGVLQDPDRVTTATLYNMRIEQQDGAEILSFDMRPEPQGGSVWSFVLTKVP